MRAAISLEREFKLYRVYTYQVVLVDRGVLRILQLEMVPHSKTLLYLGRLYHPCHPVKNNVSSINGRFYCKINDYDRAASISIHRLASICK